MTEINAENFTSSDFLSPKQVAKKLNADPEVVRKELLRQFRLGTQILIGKKKLPRPLVHKKKASHRSESNKQSSPLMLHPLGMELFKEILNKGAEK